MTRRARAVALCELLARTYPSAHCELDYTTPLELLVATILSAQCTDRRVNLVTPELFRLCRSAADYVALPPEHLEELIRSAGFYRSKAKNIRACCAALVERHGGEVPRTMEELHALAGVGRKTANVVLGNAFGINVGVVVDTHVQRVSTRLGLTKNADPVKIEQDLMPLIPACRLDGFQPLAHLARPPPVLRPEAGLPRLRAARALPECGPGADDVTDKFRLAGCVFLSAGNSPATLAKCAGAGTGPEFAWSGCAGLDAPDGEAVQQDGRVCAITVEHARDRADLPRFSYERAA